MTVNKPPKSDPVSIARKIKITDVFRLFEIPVQDKYCLIRCFRPEKHKNNDVHPSMVVDPARNRARCFVCDNKYLDSIALTIELGDFNFMTAVRFLSKKDFKKYYPKKKNTIPNDFERIAFSTDLNGLRLKKNIVEFIERQSTEFENLSQNITIEMIQYHCEKRGISLSTLIESGIRSIIDQSKLTDFSNESKRKCDVAIAYKRVFQQKGPALFFNLRSYEKQTNRKKEIIATKSPLCSFYTSPGDFLPGQLVFICEGYIDALTAASRGLQAISVPGGISSFRKEWTLAFKERKLIPVVAYDSEPGANEKAYEVLNMFLSDNIIGYRLLLPDDEDVNSFFLNHERAMRRLNSINTPVADASSTVVGYLKWVFNNKAQKFEFETWKSRYFDQH